MNRPARPLSLSARKQVFIEEVIAEALRDGLVVQSDAIGGAEPSYALTPAGEAWLRELPADMLACYPIERECGKIA